MVLGEINYDKLKSLLKNDLKINTRYGDEVTLQDLLIEDIRNIFDDELYNYSNECIINLALLYLIGNLTNFNHYNYMDETTIIEFLKENIAVRFFELLKYDGD